jgi:hypothetical protein
LESVAGEASAAERLKQRAAYDDRKITLRG